MVKFQNIEILGWFCWWTIKNVAISRVDFQALLKSVGLDYNPRDTGINRSAFVKAVDKVRSAHKKEGKLIRKIKAKGDEYVYGLVNEHADAAEHLHYRHECTMRFYVKTGIMMCDNADHPSYQLVVKYYDYYLETIDSDEARNVLLAMLHNTFAVTVRQRGGIYFIAAEFSTLLEKLEKLINGLGADCYLALAPQIDEERTKKSIYKAFVEGLTDRIAEFKEKLEGNMSDASHKYANRQHEALCNRLEEYRTMKKEIEFYADALDFQAVNLREQLDGLGEQLQRKLAE